MEPSLRGSVLIALCAVGGGTLIVLGLIGLFRLDQGLPILGGVAILCGFALAVLTIHIYRLGWLDCSRVQGDGKDICR